jgi:ABC-2 type transport system ATP-binding protein
VEFIEYFALLKEVPPGRVNKAVAVAVERVDLGFKAKARLRTLSGGMLRRVGIAQAIVNEPELLLRAGGSGRGAASRDRRWSR